MGEVTVGILVGKEGGNERRVERGCVNGEEEMGRERDAGGHVLEDEGLVLQLLPLSCSEWKPVSSSAHCLQVRRKKKKKK